MRTLSIIAVGLMFTGCHSLDRLTGNASRHDYPSIGGNYSGQLRAGDVIGFHNVTMNLAQYDAAVTGSLVYDGTTYTVSGDVKSNDANLTLTQPGCSTPVDMWLKIVDGGLTVGITGNTGCSSLSASGYEARS